MPVVHSVKIVASVGVVAVGTQFTDEVECHIGIGKYPAARGINKEIKRCADGGDCRYWINSCGHSFVWFDCNPCSWADQQHRIGVRLQVLFDYFSQGR